MATGMQSDRRYLPVGCLVHSRDQVDSLWNTSRRYKDLVSQQWIQIEPVPSSNDDHALITRVYVLPDDSENSRISRADPALRRKRAALLASLDFSSAAWNGEDSTRTSSASDFPAPAPQSTLTAAEDDRDMSLLRMFNTIPSPDPDVKLVKEQLPREFMSELLAGAVDGLTTEMYPYQCRSAALMHQKEARSVKVLDPRLIEVLDQEGNPYYYNSVQGNVFREPRFYDAVRGGILAEEMGAGKTLICLALIAATRHQPTRVPDLYQGSRITIRPRVGSLMDMAAAIATRHGCPWKRYIDPVYEPCIKALERNPGFYFRPRPESRRASRASDRVLPPYKIYLSHTTLIVAPQNLLKQWASEISKHTQGLRLKIVSPKTSSQLSDAAELSGCDIILCSTQRLERIWQIHKHSERDGSWTLQHELACIHYKRCIVDEGHILGNVRLSGSKTDLLQALDSLTMTARWIVTGTPSKGLFGVEESSGNNTALGDSVGEQERGDIERIGSIARFYLKARPWANTIHDHGDTPADWKVYVMQPKHGSRSSGRRDCLRSTLNSLIIRHRVSEVRHMLPSVDVKVVRLEGSYQDKLCLNLFSMMIIFNAIQSQRTDQDYFFHPRNRKSLLRLISNLRQASFFGGAFFTSKDIDTAVQTAEDFLEKKEVPVNETDGRLLQAAIEFGKVAAKNKAKEVASIFHEMPIHIKSFPGNADSSSWSMCDTDDADTICTNWKMMTAAQKVFHRFLKSNSADLNTYLNSPVFEHEGRQVKLMGISEVEMQEGSTASQTLAGNVTLREELVSPRKRHSAPVGIETTTTGKAIPTPPQTPEGSIEIPEPLAETRLVSTCSAKLSYLIDAIVAHQKDEQILVFYEDDNVAWYLAGMLDMLQIHHLIYAKGLTSERRAQYVSTFTHSTKFRVLLMDISQAAFGLDMRSASRVYFINPVLNPQVEAQAIGRVRRISQQKGVTVETLVLKDSLEEVIIERKEAMTQAEHRNCKTILDDRPIYNWILNPKIIPLPEDIADAISRQMTPLKAPQYIFGREYGRDTSHPDQDILMEDPSSAPQIGVPNGKGEVRASRENSIARKTKFGRVRGASRGRIQSSGSGVNLSASSPRLHPLKRARFDEDDTSEAASGTSTPSLASHPEPQGRGPDKKTRFAEDMDDEASRSSLPSMLATAQRQEDALLIMSETGSPRPKGTCFADDAGEAEAGEASASGASGSGSGSGSGAGFQAAAPGETHPAKRTRYADGIQSLEVSGAVPKPEAD